jgi:hypothetical protein
MKPQEKIVTKTVMKTNRVWKRQGNKLVQVNERIPMEVQEKVTTQVKHTIEVPVEIKYKEVQTVDVPDPEEHCHTYEHQHHYHGKDEEPTPKKDD